MFAREWFRLEVIRKGLACTTIAHSCSITNTKQVHSKFVTNNKSVVVNKNVMDIKSKVYKNLVASQNKTL